MKSGIVAVVGKANAGKSTLINVLVGEKVSIVSPKPQTTRDRIEAVLNGDNYQIVFEDTPGIYRAKSRLNDVMQRTVDRTAKDVDVVLFVIDGNDGLLEEDLKLLGRYTGKTVPVVVAFTKIDIMPEEKMYDELKEFSDIEGIKEVVPISARKGKNLKKLVSILVSLLPEGESIYGDDVISNKSERFMVSEIMREKILLKYDKEIPHGVCITVNKFERRKDGLYDINLDIICEKQNHKAILIGKQGKALKEVSSFAREGMEKFLDAKVFLTVYVKVKENWRDNDVLIKEYGYTEE